MVNDPPSADSWNTPLIRFLAHCDRESAFEEFYCLVFVLFDGLWVDSKATYMVRTLFKHESFL
jgi:hypothetical protein